MYWVSPIRIKVDTEPWPATRVPLKQTNRRCVDCVDTVQPRASPSWSITMPEPWDQKRIAGLIGMLQELIEAWPGLDDDDTDAVVAILLPKLWRRSGLDLFAFRAAVAAVLLPAKSDRFNDTALTGHSIRLACRPEYPPLGAGSDAMRKGGLDGLWNEIVARYLAMAAKSEPVPVPDGKVEPERAPELTASEHGAQRQAVGPKRARRKRKPVQASATPTSGPIPAYRYEWSGRPSERARALVRERLKHGPKPEAEIEAAAQAAEIPKRSLIAAASVLGVRTQKGQWWIPGQR
jgi:hypothetical protein